MPLRPRWEAAIGATRGAPSLSTHTVYCVLLGMLQCVPLRPRRGAAIGATQRAASLSTRTVYGVAQGRHCVRGGLCPTFLNHGGHMRRSHLRLPFRVVRGRASGGLLRRCGFVRRSRFHRHDRVPRGLPFRGLHRGREACARCVGVAVYWVSL